jgi:DNA-binding helix-hairpin-helix protein with protein kinase domain
LTPDEQVRFHNLLMLAKESPFEGERENALAAAERLAKRHGMTLDEAAMRQAQPAAAPRAQPNRERMREKAAFVHMTDYQIHVEKQQRDTARQEAEARGLDRKEREAAARRRASRPTRQARRSTARMDPDKHAWALVRETRLTYHEIARITGLDIYEVLLMKIQVLRAA